MEKQKLKLGVGMNTKAKYVTGIGPRSQQDQTCKKTGWVYLGRETRLSDEVSEAPAILLSMS